MAEFAYPDQSDSVIWQQFRQGNQEAFAHMYHRFFNDLYDYGCKLGRKPDFIEDCIQDFFLYLWQHRENLSVVKNIRFYLIKSFRRRILQDIKQDRSREKRAGIFGQSQQQVELSFEHALIQSETGDERRQAILKALDLLSPRQKEVVYLKYYQELSYKEIASVLNLNYQSVVNHFHEAFKVLKKHKTMIWATIISVLTLWLMMG